jgi:hypothetical protein
MRPLRWKMRARFLAAHQRKVVVQWNVMTEQDQPSEIAHRRQFADSPHGEAAEELRI